MVHLYGGIHQYSMENQVCRAYCTYRQNNHTSIFWSGVTLIILIYFFIVDQQLNVEKIVNILLNVKKKMIVVSNQSPFVVQLIMQNNTLWQCLHHSFFPLSEWGRMKFPKNWIRGQAVLGETCYCMRMHPHICKINCLCLIKVHVYYDVTIKQMAVLNY